MKEPGAGQLFDFFNSFENGDYMPELGLWFLRTMVMSLKNRPNNRWGLFLISAQHWNKPMSHDNWETNMRCICCEAYVMADVH
jgi:hypothetical protein